MKIVIRRNKGNTKEVAQEKMIGAGRESKADNDLFFIYGLIEYIARKTKNHREVVVNLLGREHVAENCELADVYHSDNIDRVNVDFIDEAGIEKGDFDNAVAARYAVPSHWDIGKVYKQLILGISRVKEEPIVDALFEAYNSFMSEKIQDYNSGMYYEIPENILAVFWPEKFLTKEIG